jgi:ABC-type nitrate/sulfonate/bicarbonate transport system ATPase subunit
MRVIEIRNLAFAYNGSSPIFEGFSWSVEQGDAWAILGPSGCGKTTLLHLLAGLRSPGSGDLRIGGVPLARPRPRTGLILQDHGLLPWERVEQNAGLGLRIRRLYGPDGRHTPAEPVMNPAVSKERVLYWLSRLGIEEFKKKYPSQLSRGQRQRTAIARTLVMEPDLLLMDEPFSALDVAIRGDLQRLILDLHQETGMTFVLVTHDMGEALWMGEKILLLPGGCNRGPQILKNPLAGLNDSRSHPSYGGLQETLQRFLEGAS